MEPCLQSKSCTRVGTRAFSSHPPTSLPSEGTRAPGSPAQHQGHGRRLAGVHTQAKTPAAPGSSEWRPRREKVTSNPACAPDLPLSPACHLPPPTVTREARLGRADPPSPADGI